MDLVPNIAFGDLGQSSLAEVVASGFRAFATGTVAIEQGRGESRLFFRYGIPCGAILHVGSKPFGTFLIEQRVIGTNDLERLTRQAAMEQRRLGELLVVNGLITEERLVELVNEHHRAALSTLCVLREGKYELRGWERPPDWTDIIAIDPLRAVVAALVEEELFDRRTAIFDRISHERLRLADDFDDQTARLALTTDEQRVLARLHIPRTAEDLSQSLGGDDGDAFIAGLVLLGLVDAVSPGASTQAPAAVSGLAPEPVYEDAELLLRPLDPTIPPPRAPSVPPDDFILEDASSLLRPIEATIPPPPAVPAPAQRPVGPTPAPRTNTLLMVPALEFTESDLSEIGLGPPEIFQTEEPQPPPDLKPAKTVISRGEVEFEPTDEDEPPLELDMQRAPASMRERYEATGLTRNRSGPNPSISPRARSGRSLVPPSRTAAPPPPPLGRSSSASKPISVIGQRYRVPEYNPFAVHFRKGATAAELIDRPPMELTPGPSMSMPVPRRETSARHATVHPMAAPDHSSSPTQPPAPPPIPAPPPSPTAASAQILADIADDLDGEPEIPAEPIDIDPTHVGRTASASDPSDDDPDDLAILAARESEAVASQGTGKQLTTSADAEEETKDGDGVDVPVDTGPVEASHEHEVTPAEGGADTRRPTADKHPAPQDLRRQMRLRSMKNVPGGVLSLRAPHPGTGKPDTPEPRPAVADAELEKDVANRVSRLVQQDHFARLELRRDAETDDVKEAFLSLAKRYHPDRITAMGQNHLLPQVRELFARIKESYDVLTDPASRARYLADLNEKEGLKLKLSPEEAKAAFQRGQHYLKKRDFANAEANLVRAVSGDPQGEYLTALAEVIYQNVERRDESRNEMKDLLSRALKSGTETDKTYVMLAYVARLDGESDKVEKNFRKALEHNPKNIEAARELRLIESRRGKGGGGKGGGGKGGGGAPGSGFFDRLRPGK